MLRIGLLTRLVLMIALLVTLLGAWGTVAVRAAAPFPITETFRGASADPNWVLGGGAILTAASGIDPADDGWLRLTPASGNKSGYAYYNVAFPSDRGVAVTFDYASWGGSGADGLTFFLFDGATPTFRVGGYGGSLGYAQRSGVLGLSRGYLGVGIDEFGNYSNPTEGRVGGPGLRKDAVAIRGPGDGSTGYAYLVGTQSLPQSIDAPGMPNRPNQGSAHYRRVELNLEPIGGAYRVSLRMQFGANQPLTEIIPPTVMSVAPPATPRWALPPRPAGAPIITKSAPSPSPRRIRRGPLAGR